MSSRRFVLFDSILIMKFFAVENSSILTECFCSPSILLSLALSNESWLLEKSEESSDELLSDDEEDLWEEGTLDSWCEAKLLIKFALSRVEALLKLGAALKERSCI